jgi:hypothetical protein
MCRTPRSGSPTERVRGLQAEPSLGIRAPEVRDKTYPQTVWRQAALAGRTSHQEQGTAEKSTIVPVGMRPASAGGLLTESTGMGA